LVLIDQEAKVAKKAGVESIRECLSKARGPLAATGMGLGVAVPNPVDVYQTESSLVIKVYVPGFKRQEIRTSVTDEKVRITGEHKERAEERGEYLCREQQYVPLDREISIPIPVQRDRAKLTLEDGVLTLVFPRAGRTAQRE